MLSREDVLRVVKDHKVRDGKRALVEKLEKLPDAISWWDNTPQSGLLYCVKCKGINKVNHKFQYCPNCGRFMVR